MSEEKTQFSTRDIYLAATLVTLKFPLFGTDMQIEGIKSKMIGYFKFQDSEDLHTAKSNYNQGLVLVEPRMYINNLQGLKAEVTNMQMGPQGNYNNRS